MAIDPEQVGEQIRDALIQAALTAYEDAGIRGLCCEGAWEVAVDAMRQLDLSLVIAQELPRSPGP